MEKFIKGLTLCEQFFNTIAHPILESNFPDLIYTAGLIGYGSDVLELDDITSTDHMWGPRFYLFLEESDYHLKEALMDTFSRALPYDYNGYSVNFSKPNDADNGIRHLEPITSGKVSPLIFIYTIQNYLDDYLGTSDLKHLTLLDWLSFSEHRLLALNKGRLFVDDLNLKSILEPIAYYPKTIKLYLIASNWSLIAEEQAFVKRCFDVGDNTGSVLVCARIAERLMRLAYLYCNTYAPYSKWFGKSFALLPIDPEIITTIEKAVTSSSIKARERHIVNAQKYLADLHNTCQLTEFVDIKIEPYFGRDIQVIFPDKLVNATLKQLEDTPLYSYPLIGTLSAVGNFVTLSDDPKYRENIKKLYD